MQQFHQQLQLATTNFNLHKSSGFGRYFFGRIVYFLSINI